MLLFLFLKHSRIWAARLKRARGKIMAGKIITFDDIRSVYGKNKVHPIGTMHYYSVLVPIVERDDGELCVMYEMRTRDMERQPGETCFPGGHIEKGETAEQCAVRETEEEVGIPADHIKVIGQGGTLYNGGRGGFALYSFIGEVPYEDYLNAKIEKSEVEEIFLVPVSELALTKIEIYSSYTYVSIDPQFPYERVGISSDYAWGGRGRHGVLVAEVGGRIIWGMTLRITLDVLETLGLIPKRNWNTGELIDR